MIAHRPKEAAKAKSDSAVAAAEAALDGSVGATKDTVTTADGIVDAINQARRDEYARIAEKHDIPVTQVETVAGQKALERTPSGQYILKDGQWVKK